MNFTEAAKLSAESRLKNEAEIEAYAEQFRPKVIEQRQENGYLITVYSPGGFITPQFVKPSRKYYGSVEQC